MTTDQLIAIARERNFKDLESIKKLARSAVVLRPNKESGNHVTRSRLGGLPDLPVSVPWPRWNGRSLAFIGQIDLSAQPQIAVQEGFPGEGLLLFFYDTEQSTWGFDPKDAGSFAVLYVPESTPTLADWPADIPEDFRYLECGLRSEEGIALPPWDSVMVESLHLDAEQIDAYQNVLDAVAEEDAWSSRVLLGGYPDQIQGDMMLECALVRAGLYCGDDTAYQDPRLPSFRQQAREWRLLLQVPSADEAGMMWGDLGCLYYWIREDDLAARRFDRVWMILQCG